MEWAALVTWVVTAAFGFTMLVIWLRHGGLQKAPGGKIPPWLIFSHFALAASGLVLWIVYVATDTDALAWVAFIVLLFVAVLDGRCSSASRVGATQAGPSRRRHLRSATFRCLSS